MTKYIYGPHGYLYVPLGFVFGIALSVGWYVLTRFIKKIGSFDLVKDFHMAILMFVRSSLFPVFRTGRSKLRMRLMSRNCLFLNPTRRSAIQSVIIPMAS